MNPNGGLAHSLAWQRNEHWCSPVGGWLASHGRRAFCGASPTSRQAPPRPCWRPMCWWARRPARRSPPNSAAGWDSTCCSTARPPSRRPSSTRTPASTLAMLWVPKLIIDAVVAWVSHRSGSLHAHLEAGGAGVRTGGAQRLPVAGQQPLRQPARRPLHEPGQRPPDAARHRARSRHLRGPGVPRQAGAGAAADDRPDGADGEYSESRPGHGEPDLALGRADRVLALADGAAGGRRDPGVSRREPLQQAGVLGAVPPDAAAPAARLPAAARRERAEREGSQNLRLGRLSDGALSRGRAEHRGREPEPLDPARDRRLTR